MAPSEVYSDLQLLRLQVRAKTLKNLHRSVILWASSKVKTFMIPTHSFANYEMLLSVFKLCCRLGHTTTSQEGGKHLRRKAKDNKSMCIF